MILRVTPSVLQNSSSINGPNYTMAQMNGEDTDMPDSTDSDAPRVLFISAPLSSFSSEIATD